MPSAASPVSHPMRRSQRSPQRMYGRFPLTNRRPPRYHEPEDGGGDFLEKKIASSHSLQTDDSPNLT